MQTLKLNENQNSKQEFIQRKSSNTSFVTKTQYLENFDQSSFSGASKGFGKNSPNLTTASTREDNQSQLNDESIFSSNMSPFVVGKQNVTNLDRPINNSNILQNKMADHQKNSHQVIKLADQLEGQHLSMLPRQLDEISSLLDDDDEIVGNAIPVQASTSHPSPALSCLMGPNPQFGRKRFYSSINDINGKIEYGQVNNFAAFEDSGSSKSTAFSNFAYDINIALPQSTVQKKREHQVLERISKIWNEMAILKQEVQQRSVSDMVAHQKGITKLNISKELSVENPLNCGSLFMNHQLTRRNQDVAKIEKELTIKVNMARNHRTDKLTSIADLICQQLKVEPVVAQPIENTLSLQPQFSSDFLSITSLQKEIDQKCLASQVGQTKLDKILEC